MMRRCGAELEGRLLGRCERAGSVKRGDRWFCWQHDPGRAEAEAREAAAERAAREAGLERRFARELLERGAGLRPDQVAALTDADLEMLAAAGGVLAFLPPRG
jgi:hypothetical protein